MQRLVYSPNRSRVVAVQGPTSALETQRSSLTFLPTLFKFRSDLIDLGTMAFHIDNQVSPFPMGLVRSPVQRPNIRLCT